MVNKDKTFSFRIKHQAKNFFQEGDNVEKDSNNYCENNPFNNTLQFFYRP